jgi:anti-sigma28 factor (negative regulator of flagellin synthesis)
LGRKPIPEGRLENLFPDRSNSFREDKPLKSTQLVEQSDKPPSGSLRRFTDLQSMKDVGNERFKHKTLAEIKEEIDGGQYVDDGESHDEIWETQDVGDGES